MYYAKNIQYTYHYIYFTLFFFYEIYSYSRYLIIASELHIHCSKHINDIVNDI